jgi:hypothetical protein
MIIARNEQLGQQGGANLVRAFPLGKEGSLVIYD